MIHNCGKPTFSVSGNKIFRFLWFVVRLKVFVFLSICASVFIGWYALRVCNFLYHPLYEILRIEETIAVYAPRNAYRQGFDRTDRAERERIFSSIVDSIHSQGRGLSRIEYHTPSGVTLGHFLTQPEILHLQMVSILVDILTYLGLVALITTSIWAFLISRQNGPAFSFSFSFGFATFIYAAIALAVYWFGVGRSSRVFHSVIFPGTHVWQFAYDASLMVALMKAPDLFFWIGGILAFIAWVITAILLGLPKIIREMIFHVTAFSNSSRSIQTSIQLDNSIGGGPPPPGRGFRS